MRKTIRNVLAILILVLVGGLTGNKLVTPPDQESPVMCGGSALLFADVQKPVVEQPVSDIGALTLEARKAEQMKTVGNFKTFYQFQFTDRLPESGITFIHRIVDDAGKKHKPIHYDHGSGIVVADVDGDGFHDVYFINQLGSSELYRNLGNGKFENVTQTAGVGLADRIGVTASFADFDNDGDQDLFVTTIRTGNVLLENDGKGKFKDISKAAGVDYSGHSSGAVFFDFDLDGKLDLFVTNVGKYTSNEKGRGGYYIGIEHGFFGHTRPELNENNILYRNLGNKRFANVTARMGLEDATWGGDAAFADVNLDGYPDLYVLNMQGDDYYYENSKGQKFILKTQVFPKTPWGAMGVKFFDSNNDGLMDLLVTDMHSDMSEEVGPDREKLKSNMKWPAEVILGRDNNIFGNAFYRNLGNGKFEEVSDAMGLENYWPWGVSVDDLNADGYEDVLITSSMNFPYRYGVNSLLLNNNGEKFLDSEFILGIEPRRGGRTKTHWFDLDCGGNDKGNPLCGNQTASFSVNATLGTRSAVIFDVDNDGDLDIVTNDFNSEPQVFISNLSEKKEIRYVKVQLDGAGSNKNGLGAQVTVYASGKSHVKTNDGKSGYLSQSSLPLYFGLGDAKEIEKIVVLWPSGKKQVVDKAAANTTVRIEEPK